MKLDIKALIYIGISVLLKYLNDLLFNIDGQYEYTLWWTDKLWRIALIVGLLFLIASLIKDVIAVVKICKTTINKK